MNVPPSRYWCLAQRPSQTGLQDMIEQVKHLRLIMSYDQFDQVVFAHLLTCIDFDRDIFIHHGYLCGLVTFWLLAMCTVAFNTLLVLDMCCFSVIQYFLAVINCVNYFTCSWLNCVCVFLFVCAFVCLFVCPTWTAKISFLLTLLLTLSLFQVAFTVSFHLASTAFCFLCVYKYSLWSQPCKLAHTEVGWLVTTFKIFTFQLWVVTQQSWGRWKWFYCSSSLPKRKKVNSAILSVIVKMPWFSFLSIQKYIHSGKHPPT